MQAPLCRICGARHWSGEPHAEVFNDAVNKRKAAVVNNPVNTANTAVNRVNTVNTSVNAAANTVNCKHCEELTARVEKLEALCRELSLVVADLAASKQIDVMGGGVEAIGGIAGDLALVSDRKAYMRDYMRKRRAPAQG